MSEHVTDDLIRRGTPVLHSTDTVEDAVLSLLKADLPALPVTDERDHLAGIFGEREFIEALFPGYLGQLRHTAFVPRSLDVMLERRQECRLAAISGYMNRERIWVSPDSSDTQIAEIFLHHRVLIIPVVREKSVEGLITRRDFFDAAARRFVGGAE